VGLTLSEGLTLEKCPHCKVDMPNLRKVHNMETCNYQGNDKKTWGVYVCSRCGRLVTAAAKHWNLQVMEYYPKLDTIDENIPTPARDYLEQANDTLHAPAGSILLCGSAVDSMLKLKGYKEGSLNTRINQATNDHLITKEMSDWAHRVRLGANEQRHSDETAGLPTIENAQHSLDFAKALGQFLFVLPSRIEKGIKATEAASPQE
jgi:hypothetical protein